MENKNNNTPVSSPQGGSKNDSTTEPFIPFGRYLLADYKSRLITYRELELYNWLRFHANMFGIASVDVQSILSNLPHFKSLDFINRKLGTLRNKKYIHYEDRKGHRGYFDVRFDYWLAEGGVIMTLGKDGGYKLRGERLSSNRTATDVTPTLSSQSPRSGDEESFENSPSNQSSIASNVRGDKNDKEIENEKETYPSSTTIKGKKSSEKIVTHDFVGKNDVEQRCKEIAIEVGDKYINFILSALNDKNGGIKVIEEAFLHFQDVIRIAEEKGDDDPIENPPAFFNTCVTNAIYDNQDRIKNPHLYE